MNDSDSLTIRDTLFGDMDLSKWPGDRDSDLAGEVWQLFLRAHSSLEAGNSEEAIHALEEIVALPGLESRHYLQAWSVLRSLGVTPSEAIASQVLGVIVEVALEEGLDIVAAYADHTARYFNFSGAGVVWDAQQDPITRLIDELLRSGEAVVKVIGPWQAPRPPAPRIGRARINMLTPGGLYFGEGPLEVLSRDALGGPVIKAAIELMQALIARTQ